MQDGGEQRFFYICLKLTDHTSIDRIYRHSRSTYERGDDKTDQDLLLVRCRNGLCHLRPGQGASCQYPWERRQRNVRHLEQLQSRAVDGDGSVDGRTEIGCGGVSQVSLGSSFPKLANRRIVQMGFAANRLWEASHFPTRDPSKARSHDRPPRSGTELDRVDHTPNE